MRANATAENLTEAFYAWERCGRGWTRYPYRVALEPAFEPFWWSVPAASPALDDGRKPTWLSAIVERFMAQPVSVVLEDAAGGGGILAPEPCDGRDDALRELEILVSPDARVDMHVALAWLASISTCLGPLAFEILGSDGAVSLRFACGERDVEHVVTQLRAFFPFVGVQEVKHSLSEQWQVVAGKNTAVVELGLAREFMLPLAFAPRGPDTLTPFVGVLARVRSAELGLIQVLFETVRAPWAESISRAVTTPRGEPFFADAPEITKWAREKVASPLYAVVVRIAAKAESDEAAWELVRSLGGGFTQFGSPNQNELVPLAAEDAQALEDDLLSRATHRSGMIWSQTELVSLVHLPDESLRHPALRRTQEPLPAAPAEILGESGVVLGQTQHVGSRVPVRLPQETRLRHMHIVGASGTGKSTLLVSLILQDIERGAGVGVIDPHGDLVDEILARLPRERSTDVILLDPSNEAHVVGWNILGAHSQTEKDILASDLVAVFRRLSTSWGDQMTAVLANAVLAFLESDRGGTLLELRRFLVDEEFREEFLESVHDPHVATFWRQEFPLLVGKKPQGPILTRLDTFLRSRLVRAAVTEQEKPIDFREVIDRERIFLARLSQGAIGQENAALLGALLVSKFHQVSLARQDVAAATRRPFFLFVDEFQEVATPSMAALFSGVRKYHLGLTVAHQDLYQLHAKVPEVERAVLANAYTRICFRVADDDARRLERGLGRFTADDLLNLRTGEAICRVGRKEDDFRLRTALLTALDPVEAEARRQSVARESFGNFGSPRVTATMPRAVSTRPPRAPAEEAPSSVLKPSVSVVPRPRAVETETGGSGSPEHKYMQEMIRQWGQARGFRATFERPLPSGGRVDVALERKELSIACEIAVTTTLEHELGNVKKCLAEPFQHVVVLSLKAGFLKQIQDSLGERFATEEISRVKLLSPQEFPGFLDSLVVGTSEQRVAGYGVRLRYRKPTAEQEQAQKRAIADVVLKSVRRVKGK